MSMILLSRGSQQRVNPVFCVSEFFCKCPDFTDFCHPFDDTLFKAAMIIRYFTKHPVIITSSYRTTLCNKNSGGAPNSYHLLGKALDLNCGSALETVTSDIISKGPLYRSLRQIGINGFGISPDFLHIDTRSSGSAPDSEFGSYSLWHY
jgi:zinc D-Ala-D-Ala carboxypeptidase